MVLTVGRNKLQVVVRKRRKFNFYEVKNAIKWYKIDYDLTGGWLYRSYVPNLHL